MAATVKVYEYNGIFASETDQSQIYYNSQADAASGYTNLARPAGGSYEKYHRFNVTGGTFSSIRDLCVYTDGSPNMPIGSTLYAKTAASFPYPVTIPTTTSGYTDFYSYTSASPLSLGTGPYTTTGGMGNFLASYVKVSTVATGYESTSDTITFSWDEI